MRTDRAETAETIFRNGILWTGIDGPRHATALAVTGGRITAVGADDDVLALRGPNTDVVDLAGQTLIPGFVDAHVHAIQGDLELSRCNLVASTRSGTCTGRDRTSPPAATGL